MADASYVYDSACCVVSRVYNVEYGKSVVKTGASGQDDGETAPLLCDLYVPLRPDGMRAPVLVATHGGAFESGSRLFLEHVGEHFGRRGWLVVSIDYRLIKDEGYIPPRVADWVKKTGIGIMRSWNMPDSDQRLISQARAAFGGVRDLRAAIRWTRANVTKFGGNANSIALLGDSAGGAISLAAALCTFPGDFAVPEASAEAKVAKNRGVSEAVDCVVSFCGAPLLVELFGSIPDAKSKKISLRYQKSSPPALQLHGTVDETVPFPAAKLLEKRYQNVGAECEFVAMPNFGHCDWESVDSKGRKVLPMMTDFLNRRMKLAVRKPVAEAKIVRLLCDSNDAPLHVDGQGDGVVSTRFPTCRDNFTVWALYVRQSAQNETQVAIFNYATRGALRVDAKSGIAKAPSRDAKAEPEEPTLFRGVESEEGTYRILTASELPLHSDCKKEGDRFVSTRFGAQTGPDARWHLEEVDEEHLKQKPENENGGSRCVVA